MKLKIHPEHNQLAISQDGQVFSLNTGKFVVPYTLKRGGYKAITVCTGKRGDIKTRNKCLRVHVLVLETFRGPRPEGYHGAHLDGNSQNNKLENLAWVTPAENNRHRILHGTVPRGEDNPNVKVTEEMVRLIRKKFPVTGKRCKGIKAFSKSIGLNRSTVQRIRRGELWTHIK